MKRTGSQVSPRLECPESFSPLAIAPKPRIVLLTVFLSIAWVWNDGRLNGQTSGDQVGARASVEFDDVWQKNLKPLVHAVMDAESSASEGISGNSQIHLPWNQLRSEESKNLPIGVFDSGVGGLTVLDTILKLDAYNNRTATPGQDGIPDFAGERFIYLGDQANMPYGNYAAAGKVHFLRELIVRDAMFLLGDRYWASADAKQPSYDKPTVKAIVIACNTATAFGLDDIRRSLREMKLEIPVIGVVEAGASALVAELPPGGPSKAVAVMATVGTCSSNAYPKAIATAAGQAGKRIPTVWQQGSVGLAGAIEGNPSFVSHGGNSETSTYLGPSADNKAAKIDSALRQIYGFDPSGLRGDIDAISTWKLSSVENYVKFDVVAMLEGYRQSHQNRPIEQVVLGCTHFPFEAERIEYELMRLREIQNPDGSHPYRALIADKVQLVDPAELTAKELFKTLFSRRMRSESALRNASDPTADSNAIPVVEHFFLSVANPRLTEGIAPDGGLTNEFKYGRDGLAAGGGDKSIEETLFVPLIKSQLPTALSDLLREKCQHVWKALRD